MIREELEKKLLELIKSCAITGRLEYHTFPPPEYFAEEMTLPLSIFIKQLISGILKKKTSQVYTPEGEPTVLSGMGNFYIRDDFKVGYNQAKADLDKELEKL